MKIVYTLHAKEKLEEKEAKDFKIDRSKIKVIIETPLAKDTTLFPHRLIGKLNDKFSLCVIYKIENRAIIVITFYPAKKGRYESKVLRRR